MLLPAFVYLILIAGFAAYIYRTQLDEQDAYKWLICVGIFTAAVTLNRNVWLLYAAVIGVGWYIVPKDPEKRIFYYLTLFCILPRLSYEVPFPGVNYLIVMEYPFILSLALLLPLFWQFRKAGVPHSKFDLLIAVYLVYVTYREFSFDDSFTYWARLVLVNFFSVWVPYYVIANAPGDLKRYMVALLYGGIYLTVAANVEWALTWQIFANITQYVNDIVFSRLSTAYYFRGLGLRISSSWMNPISFGVFAAGTCYLLLMLQKLGKSRSMLTFALAGLALSATLFTDSRGALLTMIIALGVQAYFYSPTPVWKNTYKLCFVVAVLLVAMNFQTFMDLDPSGTFQYRADLLVYSKDAFFANPIWGDVNFRDNYTLSANMTQGQGIVDIVNHYLNVALRYGAVGLFLYLLIWTSIIARMISRVSQLQSLGDHRYHAGSILVSLMVGVAIVIYTVSLVGYLPEYIFMLMGLASAYLKSTGDRPKTKATAMAAHTGSAGVYRSQV